LKNLVSSKIVDGKIKPGVCRKNLFKMQSTKKLQIKNQEKKYMFVYVCKNFVMLL